MVKRKTTKKRKNVSKKPKKVREGRKESVLMTTIRKNKIAKKRNLRSRKRVYKKYDIFLYPWHSFQKWIKDGMKKIRKEQRHCLRFKKNKRKQSFCFVKALLLEYPYRTIFGFIVVIVIGLSVLTAELQYGGVEKYFGTNLQTSLISQLEAKINDLREKIFDRQKCTQDKYWTEAESNICNYWLYKQNNEHCAKFGVLTERVAIGTKMCCEPLESIVYDGDKKNVTSCPGSDIFFSRNKMHKATLVADASGCRPSVCQFYPSDGYLIKFDTQGNIVYGEEGQPIVVKPCPVKRKVGPCDKECGGGQRTITGQDMYCNQFTMTELCNVEPCFTETIVN